MFGSRVDAVCMLKDKENLGLDFPTSSMGDLVDDLLELRTGRTAAAVTASFSSVGCRYRQLLTSSDSLS
jgi:hypothetical protein